MGKFSYLKMRTISKLHELLEWWDSTDGGENGPPAFISEDVTIKNCVFVTSIKNIYMGRGAGLFGLSGLSAVDPKEAGQIMENTTLAGLGNVRHIAFEYLPISISLLNLSKLESISKQSIKDETRLTGLKSLVFIYKSQFGKDVRLSGMNKFSYFKKCEFNVKCKFSGLKKLNHIEDCKPADLVTFSFIKDSRVAASLFAGFKYVILKGVDRCVIDFDALLPEGTSLSCVPNRNKSDQPILLSSYTTINCESIKTPFDLECLWLRGGFFPNHTLLEGIDDDVFTELPEWVRLRTGDFRF